MWFDLNLVSQCKQGKIIIDDTGMMYTLYFIYSNFMIVFHCLTCVIFLGEDCCPLTHPAHRCPHHTISKIIQAWNALDQVEALTDQVQYIDFLPEASFTTSFFHVLFHSSVLLQPLSRLDHYMRTYITPPPPPPPPTHTHTHMHTLHMHFDFTQRDIYYCILKLN